MDGSPKNGAAPGTLPAAARIREKVQENPKTVTFVLDTALAAAPGQFAMLWLPGIDEKPFSIAGADPLMFTISRVGPFSEMLHALAPGDTLWVRGPFGRGYQPRGRRALLVGGGYGAAPLHFLAGALLRGGAAVEAALGARASAELLFAERFAALGVPLHLATEDGSRGMRGRVTDAVSPLLAPGRFDGLFACGPEGMLVGLDGLCRAAGVPAQLSREAYMRCGIGVCGACEHDGRLVCMDGPVFHAGGAS
jgi:dihydroorotate dehydrogenase electron transfer subunit